MAMYLCTEIAIRSRAGCLQALSAAYSWSKFGREAEYVAALYLKSLGWQVTMSKGSRGPADLIASRGDETIWLIQVKSSSKLPRLKGYEVKRLREMADNSGASPVIATLQPEGKEEGSRSHEKSGSFSTGNYSLSFYLLDGWARLNPAGLSR